MAVELDQSGTDAVMKFIKNKTSNILMGIGEHTKKELVDNWLLGKGGDNKAFKDGSPEYLARKSGKGIKTGGQYRKGEPIINMTLTGKMTQALTSQRDGDRKVNVTFLKPEQPKAEGNATKRPNMMKLSKKFKDKERDYYNKQVDKFIGATP